MDWLQIQRLVVKGVLFNLENIMFVLVVLLLQYDDRSAGPRRKGSPIPKGKFGQGRKLTPSQFGWYQVTVSEFAFMFLFYGNIDMFVYKAEKALNATKYKSSKCIISRFC